MKKIFVLAAVFMLALGVMFISEASGISVYIDGNPVAFTDGEPVIEEGRTLVPVRAVAEAMGAEVDWDGEYRVVTLTNLSWKMIYKDKEYLNCYASVRLALDTRLITITLYDSERAHVFSTVKEMDVNAKTIGGRTYIPARYIGYGLGYSVNWNEAQRRIDYNYGGVQNTDISVYTAPWKAPEIKGPIYASDALRPVSEYLGEYPGSEPDRDYPLLSQIYREYVSSEYERGIVNDFIYTKLPENQCLRDKDGNLVPVGGNGKKTILFFDGVGSDGRSLFYYGNGFETSAGSFESTYNADCYIMPNYEYSTTDADKFLNGTIHTAQYNRRYMYSDEHSAGIEGIARKVGGRTVFMLFDENGRIMFVSGGNYSSNLFGYLKLAMQNKIPLQLYFPTMTQNWFRDKRIEEACIG